MVALGRHACVGVGAVYSNDLERDVYCLLGVPVDAINMASALRILSQLRSGERISGHRDHSCLRRAGCNAAGKRGAVLPSPPRYGLR